MVGSANTRHLVDRHCNTINRGGQFPDRRTSAVGGVVHIAAAGMPRMARPTAALELGVRCAAVGPSPKRVVCG